VHTAKHFEEKIWALLAIASSGIAMLSDAVRPCHTSHMEMSERCQTYLYRHRKGACTRIIYIKKQTLKPWVPKWGISHDMQYAPIANINRYIIRYIYILLYIDIYSVYTIYEYNMLSVGDYIDC
jgi:hypothetical protein